jgi:outer membrane lipoprotein-sorting protein
MSNEVPTPVDVHASPHPASRRRRRAIRWGVPIGIAVIAVAAPSVGSLMTANAAPTLPKRTAAQLLVDVQNATVDTMSGTVVQRSDLGLPEVPGLGQGAGESAGSSSLTSLLSGTHTLRLWFAGPDQARVAVLGTLGESDIIVNGRNVWTWSSDDRTATHRTLPAHGRPESPHPSKPGGELPMTPQRAADEALAAIQPTTVVTVAGTTTVAGREAYELVLAPRDTRSLIGQVRIAIDAGRHVPLQVAVFAAGRSKAAFQIGFTSVSFARPRSENFRFTPPPGTKVTEQGTSASGASGSGIGPAPGGMRADATDAGPRIIGTGWTAILIGQLPARQTKALPKPVGPGRAPVDRVLGSLPQVSGAWGSGHLLRSDLLTVLLTDDGRVIGGAVRPELLYAAAAAAPQTGKPLLVPPTAARTK